MRRHENRHRQRGAVIVETSLTIGLGLAIILFALQVGILGFLQVTADAAAFVDAHYHAVGAPGNANPEALTHAIFPQVAPSDIATSPQPAPTILLPVDYGFNGSAAEKAATNQRHAGVSIIQPILYSTTVRPHGVIGFLGKLLGVSGSAIEPQTKECGPHFNVQEASVACGGGTQPVGYEVDPIPSPAANANSAGENTPPYYVSFNFRARCNSATQPWLTCTDILTASGTFYAFGVAEFLDANNWGATQPAAAGNGKSANGQPVSTFEYMLCHQKTFSTLAQFFNSYTSLSSLNSAYPNTKLAAVTLAAPKSFSGWNEFNASTNALVAQVYSWDAVVKEGTALNAAVEPGSNSTLRLHPDAGC